MSKLENLIRRLRCWYWARQGFIYDASKRMWFKTRSDCHNNTIHQKTLFGGKPLKKPFSEYSDKEKAKIYYRYFCDFCSKQCKALTEVKI